MHRRILAEIQHVVGAPDDELTRIQKRLRYGYELVSHCRTELIRIRAQGMAAELTYRTIFSLIPVVVLALIMFRVVGGLDDMQSKVEDQLYSFFGVPDIPDVYGTDTFADEPDLPEPFPLDYQSLSKRLDPDSPALETVPLEPPPVIALQVKEEKLQVRASIRRALQEATAKVSNIDFASIGIVGLALFIYTAVALASAIEHLFNIIYEAPSERPVHIRLAIHWSIITLGGGLLVMSLYMSAQFLDYMGGVVHSGYLTRTLNHVISTMASWVLLFLIYALMPNTHVSVRAAAVGSFAASILWELAKFSFQIYVAKTLPYSALYGSLGLIPIFLFWIYVTWMIVLFGLTLTKTLQMLHGRDPKRLRFATDALPNGDPDWMVPIMIEVARAFATGHAIDQQEIVERLQLPGTIVHPMLTRLESAGLVRRVVVSSGRDDRVTLAKPAARIPVADILAVAHQRPDGMNDDRWSYLDELNLAQTAAAGKRTLEDISGSRA